MEITALKQQIKTNKLQSMYIFTGPEWKVQQIYVDQIAKVSGKQKKYVEDIKTVFSTLKGNSFIKQPFVYILRDDKTILTDEKVQEKLFTVLGDNTLILIFTSLDKRTKFYKKYNNDICVFEQLKSNILKKYIRQAIDISDVNCDRLMEICENDYGRCLLEIDKIMRYTNYLGPAKMENGVFEKLLKDGTIYKPPYDAIFDFVDAVLKRKVKTAFNLLYQSYAVGEATMVILSVLYNNAKQVLQVQTCSSKDVSKSTGLTAWQIKCAQERINQYTEDELMYMLHLIQKCECGIKSGKIEETVAVEYILVHVL